jgi:hypothetical protein
MQEPATQKESAMSEWQPIETLVALLRSAASAESAPSHCGDLMERAADEIERMRAEILDLRAIAEIRW